MSDDRPIEVCMGDLEGRSTIIYEGRVYRLTEFIDGSEFVKLNPIPDSAAIEINEWLCSTCNSQFAESDMDFDEWGPICPDCGDVMPSMIRQTTVEGGLQNE